MTKVLQRLRHKIGGHVDAWRGKRQPHGIILLYHRVTSPPTDPQLLCVSPENFAAHLEALRDLAEVVPLSRLVADAPQPGRKRPLVAITFDDGYHDNQVNAGRLLLAASMPATFYIATAAIGQRNAFHWDELADLLLWAKFRGPSLRCTIMGREHAYDVSACLAEPVSSATEAADWDVTLCSIPTVRQAMYRNFCTLFKRAAPREREAALLELRRQTIPPDTSAVDACSMTAAEISTLGGHELFSIGAHTETHPMLSALTPEAQAEEMRRSKMTLEGITGKAVESFSYPFGGHGDFTTRSTILARECGFSSACANVPGVVWQGSSVYALPRVIVRNLNQREFAKLLTSWI